jgi:hypothetical protein
MCQSSNISMLGGSLVTITWHVLMLRMEGRPPDTEGSCEYIEQQSLTANEQCSSSLGGWAWG